MGDFMDIFSKIFNNPYRDKYTNTFDKDEYIGDYSINFRSEPTPESLDKIGAEIIEKCKTDLKKMFSYKEIKFDKNFSEGFIKKKWAFIFSKKIDIAISFVDVRDKGFIVEDYCVKISIEKSLLTGGYAFNSYITTKENLKSFVKKCLYE